MSADFNWNHEFPSSKPSEYLEAVVYALSQLRMIQMESHIANTTGNTDEWRQKLLQAIETRCDTALARLAKSSATE
jgi:hypothetical protein